MKRHKSPMPTDVIPERVDHDRQPNWLVKRRLQSALAIATAGRSFTRSSTIPLVEGLRFNLAGVDEGVLEFQGISRRAFVYRSQERPLIMRAVQLISSGLRYSVYSGPVLDRTVILGYIEAGQLDGKFLPQLCSGSVHAVELAVHDGWSKSWFAPIWYSLGKNQDTVPPFELTPEGVAARLARVATIRMQVQLPPADDCRKLAREDAMERIRILFDSQLHFIITTEIQPITNASGMLPIGDINTGLGHVLDEDRICVVYYFSGSQKTEQFRLSGFPLDRLKPVGDGYKAYVRAVALVPTGSESPDKTSHFAVITILDEKNQPVDNFICGVRA